MHHATPLITTIVGGLVLAFILGMLANKLRISPLVGYLLAGVLAGPFTPTVITWSYDEQVFRTRGLDADQTEAAIKATMKMLNLIEDEYEKSK